eukprot:UN25274
MDDDDWISEDEGYTRKRRRRNHTTRRDEAGVLLLDDALKTSGTMTGWSQARKNAWKRRTQNPNAYYYRFNKPGENNKREPWGNSEKKVFMERLQTQGANNQWGVFAMNIEGRVGYACSNYYRQLVKYGYVYDINYRKEGGDLKFIRNKKMIVGLDLVS